MKRFCSSTALFLCALLIVCFAGCGREEATQYFDIQVEKQIFYDVAGANPDVHTSFLNMQFYQGEPAQIWAVYDGAEKMNVFLYKIDGDRKLLVEDVPMEYARGGGFLDRDGNYYYWATNQGSLIKLDSAGKQLFSRPLSELGIFKIAKMCQLGDGRIYLRCGESDQGGPDRLCELDQEKGEIIKIDNDVSELYFDTYMAAGEDCLLYMTEKAVWKVDAEKATQEEAWSFVGTSYTGMYDSSYPVWDFRIQEDGGLGILQAGNNVHAKGADGAAKTLRKVAVGEGKEIAVLRCAGSDTWIKGCIQRFNEQSEDWYIMLEERDDANTSWEDYTRQTSIEIASGNGPDILYGHILGDYAYGVFRQGGFTDLSPYLEASGLKKENFFPSAFGCWQEEGKIYGVSLNVSFFNTGYGGILMDAAVLGGNEEPDIEALVDALLVWEGDAVFLREADSQGVLERFLEGTEDLWGMVDWNEGSCDFNTELFAGMLEAAKRYGRNSVDDDRPALAEQESYDTYQYLDETCLKERGKVRVGILFDDGCHASACPERTVAVNVNSGRKDGAWEFIRFMLEDGQLIQEGGTFRTLRYPVSKEAFETVMAREKAKGLWEKYNEFYSSLEGKMKYYYPLSKERIEGIKEILEDARFVPVRTQPILDIIYEEVWGYFGGTKSIDDTVRVINNRVQVYLDEGHS